MDTIRKQFCDSWLFHTGQLLFISFLIFSTSFVTYGNENENIKSSSVTIGEEAVKASKGIFTSEPMPNEEDRTNHEAYDFSTLPPVHNECNFGYEKSGITLHIRATPALNLYSGRPSTLIGALFQFADLNYVRAVANESDGIYVLLSDPSDNSILWHRRIVIQPGEKQTLIMDRVDGAKYFCVVAGYWNVDPSKCIKVYPIPTRDTYKFWFWKRGCVAAKLVVKMLIDSHSIR